MNLRIQMYGESHPAGAWYRNLQLTRFADGKSAVDCLEKGLNDLMDLCDVVENKFTIARDGFNAEKASKMET